MAMPLNFLYVDKRRKQSGTALHRHKFVEVHTLIIWPFLTPLFMAKSVFVDKKGPGHGFKSWPCYLNCLHAFSQTVPGNGGWQQESGIVPDRQAAIFSMCFGKEENLVACMWAVPCHFAWDREQIPYILHSSTAIACFPECNLLKGQR